jgi:HAD superfamily hydrolase (TIGR01509 family)
MELPNLKPKAIIFDMDGVLVDSEHWWQKLGQKFYTKLLGKWNKKNQHQIIGRSLKDIHRILQNKYGLKMSWPEFMNNYNQMAKQVYQKQCNLMPGALEVLDFLAGANIKLALASSSFRSWIDMALKRFDLVDYFNAIISAQDVGSRGKPAPDIYLCTAQKLQTDPARCIVVEDSKNGILSAKAAGMIAIGYQTPDNNGQDLRQADIIINNLKNLTIYAHH